MRRVLNCTCSTSETAASCQGSLVEVGFGVETDNIPFVEAGSACARLVFGVVREDAAKAGHVECAEHFVDLHETRTGHGSAGFGCDCRHIFDLPDGLVVEINQQGSLFGANGRIDDLMRRAISGAPFSPGCSSMGSDVQAAISSAAISKNFLLAIFFLILKRGSGRFRPDPPDLIWLTVPII